MTLVPSAFPIAGIGASAGGLEALEQFLRQIPEDCGIGFVIIQHLDPSQKGLLPELLQRITPMPVWQVQDRMKVKAGCVYVIPPNKDMSILHGSLHLFDPVAPRGLHLPIDYFLCSLAEDQQQHSIGVILSGMGSDGTLGLRAIKEKAGLVVVQEPSSAKFASMPNSAIDAGLADIVAPAEELPGKIAAFLRHVQIHTGAPAALVEKEQSAMEKIVILLRAKTGHDFSLYKKNTLYRRVERRMGIHQVDRIASYVRFLRENPQELELLFKELLIGVTNFFRDPSEWDHLYENAIPALLASYPDGGHLRAWSAGCSTGEEAYSLAMIFKDAVRQLNPKGNYTLQIFATDLDPDAIDKARQGIYPHNIAAQVSEERLQRYFIQEETGFRVAKEVREMVTFAQQNLIMDPPFTKLELLLCRNLLIYLEPALQKQLGTLFHYSLKPGGILFLGSAESVSSYKNLFTSMGPKSRLFKRREAVLSPDRLVFPALPNSVPSGTTKEPKMQEKPVNLQSLAEQLLLQNFAPPSVLTTEEGNILYISGRTGKYLEPASGKVNWNLFAMAREGLHFELTNAFKKAVRDQLPITLRGLKVGTNGGTQGLEVSIQPIQAPAALKGMVLVSFQNVIVQQGTKPSGRIRSASASSVRISELEEELSQSRQELQVTREGMQSSQEELNSMNEELQSTNEELQSTNEELTTSKEEMQSMNEELQTVNAEQMAKLDELERINNDMQNLLNSTEISTLFLDNDLRIKRFTPGATKLFKLIAGDIGRPLTDLASTLSYPDLADDAREVLRTMVFCEKQISARDRRWFTVRIMPYRTTDNRIDGVVITFIDTTTTNALTLELKETKGRLRKLTQVMPLMVIELSLEGNILELNPQVEKILGHKRTQILGRNFIDKCLAEAERPKAVKELQAALIAEIPKALTTQMMRVDQQLSQIQWTTEKIFAADGQVKGLVLIGEEISNR